MPCFFTDQELQGRLQASVGQVARVELIEIARRAGSVVPIKYSEEQQKKEIAGVLQRRTELNWSWSTSANFYFGQFCLASLIIPNVKKKRRKKKGREKKQQMRNNQHSPCLCEGVAGRRPATPSHKHGLCPPFEVQQAFMWSIAGRRPAMLHMKVC